MLPDEKFCVECEQTKLISEFALQPRGKFGRKRRCKSCVNAKYCKQRALNPQLVTEQRFRMAQWRAKNPERNREGNLARKVAMRRRIADYKAKRGCEDCGITDARVLDLHHRSGETKILAVSQMLYRASWQAVMAESEKCRVLCANCHRIEHAADDVQLTTGVFFRAS